MTLAGILAALAAPLAKRVLVALGFGIVTYTGFITVKGQFDALITSALGGIAADVYQVLALAGFVDVIGIWMGAVTTVITLTVVRRLQIL